MRLNNNIANIIKYVIIFFASTVECGMPYELVKEYRYGDFNLLYYCGFYPKIDSGIRDYYTFKQEGADGASITISSGEKLALNNKAIQRLASLMKSVATICANNDKSNQRAEPPVVVHNKSSGKYYFFDVNGRGMTPVTLLSFHMEKYQLPAVSALTEGFVVYGKKNMGRIQALPDIRSEERNKIKTLEFKNMYDATASKIKRRENAEIYFINTKTDNTTDGLVDIEFDDKVQKYLYNMTQDATLPPLVLEREYSPGIFTYRHIIIWNGQEYIVYSSYYAHSQSLGYDLHMSYVLDPCEPDVIFSEDHTQLPATQQARLLSWATKLR